MRSNMRVWGITDTGLVRKENQDAYRVDNIADYTVAVVCDGMGGTNGGRIASSIGVKVFGDEMEKVLHKGMSADQIQQAMLYSASLVNDAIRREADGNPEIRRMGTTLVAAVGWDDLAVVCNIGDSRAYRISPEGICQITKDHSLVEDMVEHGDLTPDEARRHPNRNLITRALGPDAVAQTDGFKVPWKKGDFLLLCSDGLVNTVTDQEILFEMIHNDQLDSCLDRLMTVSKGRGAPDNVTAVLLMNI